MQVRIRLQEGDKGTIEIHKREPIKNVRQAIMKLLKLENDKSITLRIFHLGKELEDVYNAFDYNIRALDTLICFPRPVQQTLANQAENSKGEAAVATPDAESNSGQGSKLTSSSTAPPPSDKVPKRPLPTVQESVGDLPDSLLEELAREDCLRCKGRQDKPCTQCGCNVCGGKDDEDKTLICEECQMYFHMACLPTPLKKIPEEDWYCHHCFNDPNVVIKRGENPQKMSKARQKMPSATCQRKWGGGMACASVNKKCTIVKPTHVGPIPGIPVGSLWYYRITLSESGVHRPPVGGIAGSSATGAVSVVLAAGYPEDEDFGEEFVYTGSGGRNLADGNKRTGAQSFDQELTRYNLALARTCDAPINGVKGAVANDWKKSRAVRVVRSYKLAKHHPKYAPEEGVRYDGIYRLVKYWPDRSFTNDFKVWRFLFRRDDPEPAPWTPEGIERSVRLGIQMIGRPENLPEGKAKGKGATKATKSSATSSSSKASSSKSANKNPLTVLQRHLIPGQVLTMIDIDKVNRRNWQKAFESKATTLNEFLDQLATDIFVCPICVELVEMPVTTECSHNVCRNCLVRSREKLGDICPVCRTALVDMPENPKVNRNLASILRAMIPSYCSDQPIEQMSPYNRKREARGVRSPKETSPTSRLGGGSERDELPIREGSPIAKRMKLEGAIEKAPASAPRRNVARKRTGGSKKKPGVAPMLVDNSETNTTDDNVDPNMNEMTGGSNLATTTSPLSEMPESPCSSNGTHRRVLSSSNHVPSSQSVITENGPKMNSSLPTDPVSITVNPQDLVIQP
ncbi:hypothetical protein IWQ62_002201 [Dispira parvispora]|uniref:RING-type E3 ubiquitin transferase n=1 Tax=Dispira parvispora TaxID=1520584 RepID=A0A9W8AWK0_9FUNG|nr:hypothetical protein IWQ62_002201 [Dispira parvispora]